MFVGRHEEQRMLAGLVAGVRDGRSGTLVLAGEPGTGKTSLLGQAGGVRVVPIAGAEPEMCLGYAALHRLLRPWLPRLDALPAPQAGALRTAFGHTAGGPADRYLVGMATLTLLAGVSTPEPLICVIDDAQWLDRETADALTFVARRLHAEALGLLFATRPDGLARLGGLPVTTLTGLPRADARSLLTARVAGHLDDTVADHLAAGTGGNPLALIELARTLTPGQLAGLVPLPAPLPVGDLLETHFLGQISPLPAPARLLLLLVSVASPGDPALLWRAAVQLGIAAHEADVALSAGLLTPALDFRHPLIRSAVHRGADPSDRRRVHAALAAVHDPVRDPDRHAWHRAQATIGLDEDVAALLEKASERGGHAVRAAFLARAADLSPGPRAQASRLVAAARAHLVLGDPVAAGQMLDRAEPGLDRPVPRALARQARATAEMYAGRYDAAPRILLEAAASITAEDAPLARRMMFEALQAMLVTSDQATMLELARTVLAAPAPADPFLIGFATRITGDYRTAVPLLRDALAAVDTDDGLPLAVISILAADDLWDEEAGRRAWSRLEAYDRDNGALGSLRTTLAVGVAWELRAGRFDAAEALQDELTGLSRVVGQPMRGEPQRIELLAWQGRETEARALAAAATGLGFLVRNSLAVLEISLGDYPAALACVQPSLEWDKPGAATRSLPEIVEAGVRSGDHETAKTALVRMEQRAPVSGTPWALGLLARCRALMADDPDALYREALDHLGRTRIVTELARTHLLYGEWLRRRRRRADARVHLHHAHDLFTHMGAAAFVSRTRSELLATGEVFPAPAARTGGHLTPQERQVATLAAAGSTNTEIAARLFLSTSTVEYHLTRIYRKLGITSRRKLAAAL
ncbi:helix-turn-helix transcriptional regulator [Paractinoplanes abujensis]|uniref:DNA-binding CsgD family transcriptional regulator/tetratricopeptide (TPR) repeat protein n=1 Tax=Paractinoplanes abujensis TaxID=882441 RepID=A0A7W7CQM9_9ACTN|nr:LuxR family transcriptional regulator [Actinoplanes abujensis]MBB4692907.1 DNA-binding CsgD family transcriptional regulator/tetratricopeptide (TPR) repeat protein [Actinoplanes abujensis]GID22593.1 helix-turn-helix transcriptional regulator [Actinoplanes abujensis]